MIRAKFSALLLAASLAISIPLGANAGEKDDVCHRTGSGEFNSINISVKAIKAHRSHGDALPGESVPGNPGYSFDDSCNMVAASTCPCNLDSAGMAAIGIDGSVFACYGIDTFGQESITVTDNNVENFGATANVDGATMACIRQQDGTLIDEVYNLDAEQYADCRSDLQSVISDLQLIECPNDNQS